MSTPQITLDGHELQALVQHGPEALRSTFVRMYNEAMKLVRLEWTLGTGVEAAIAALGANDVLRGLSPAAARSNLDAMLAALDARGIPVLAGMLTSRNLGPEYVAAFDSIYAELAVKYDLLLYPFLLAGGALDPELNQADGIHPNAQGVQVIVKGLGPLVRELADRL